MHFIFSLIARDGYIQIHSITPQTSEIENPSLGRSEGSDSIHNIEQIYVKEETNYSSSYQDFPIDNSSAGPSNVPFIYRPTTVNLEEVWRKMPNEVIEVCRREQKLSFTDRKTLVREIVNYMLFTLKDSSRGIAGEIAKILCSTYPKTFMDTIGGQSWGSGVDTVRMEIYNACMYRKKSRIRNLASYSTNSCDGTQSSSLNQEMHQRDTTMVRKQDEYGCVAYAPALPAHENFLSQEAKRYRLYQLFYNQSRDSNVPVVQNPEILRLMEETYPSIRGLLNSKTQNFEKIAIEWPFLQNWECFFQHASILLGKNVQDTWLKSLRRKVEPMRQFFNLAKNKKGKEIEIDCILNESRAAYGIGKEEISRLLVIFPLLFLYFKEEKQFLYKIVQSDIDDHNMIAAAESESPILIIAGSSLYDEKAKCIVVVNKQLAIKAKNSLDGLLITFLSYYVYGFGYPPQIEKTLEFIQRIFLDINPTTGSKRTMSAKRRPKSFDPIVFKLAKELSTFSHELSFDMTNPLINFS